jgi:chromosomal replication initiation ATPase DnaA
MKKDIFNSYATAISKQFHLSLDEMFDKSRKQEKVDARQMLYYLCMERPIRVSYIKRFMSEAGLDVHITTIIHGYKKAKELIDNDKDYKNIIESINETV